jgi:hypothetical protein
MIGQPGPIFSGIVLEVTAYVPPLRPLIVIVLMFAFVQSVAADVAGVADDVTWL